MVLLPEFSGPTCGGSPGVPSAAVSADISKVLPLRLSQVPLSDAVATDPFKKNNAQTHSGHMAFCNTELHDKWKVAKQSACHLSMVPYRDTHIHTRPPSLMDFNNRSVPPRSRPGVSPRTYSDLLWTYCCGLICLCTAGCLLRCRTLFGDVQKYLCVYGRPGILGTGH